MLRNNNRNTDNAKYLILRIDLDENLDNSLTKNFFNKFIDSLMKFTVKQICKSILYKFHHIENDNESIAVYFTVAIKNKI